MFFVQILAILLFWENYFINIYSFFKEIIFNFINYKDYLNIYYIFDNYVKILMEKLCI